MIPIKSEDQPLELLLISSKGPVLAAMKAINDLNIPNLIPLEGDIAVEELAKKAGVESDFLREEALLYCNPMIY
jgi:hypothetical protein